MFIDARRARAPVLNASLHGDSFAQLAVELAKIDLACPHLRDGPESARIADQRQLPGPGRLQRESQWLAANGDQTQSR